MNKHTTKELGACQVRSETARPCSHPATMELGGVLFCGRCAREQETYFAIGEAMEAEESAGGKSLAVVMGLMREIRLRQRLVEDHEPDAA